MGYLIVWRCLRDPAFSHFGTVSTYDRETDGQTDGRTHDDNIYRASIESRGKKN